MDVTVKPLTYGEKAVGLSFNPGNSPKVEAIKRLSATLIDEIYNEEVAPGPDMRNGEKVAMAILAIRKIQEGQMWAVKAATWQH
jgi:hypothetical protein